MKPKAIWATLSVAALVAIAQPAQAQCAAGWLSFGSSCYTSTSRAADWFSSQSEAVTLGGNLVTVNSAAENAFVWASYNGLPGTTFWIGFNDVANEGVYEWVSGQAVTYTNWYPGEPNNSNNEDAVHMIPNGAGGMWNDNNTGVAYYGVVEAEVAAVPEPASLVLLATGLLAIGGARRKLRQR